MIKEELKRLIRAEIERLEAYEESNTAAANYIKYLVGYLIKLDTGVVRL